MGLQFLSNDAATYITNGTPELGLVDYQHILDQFLTCRSMFETFLLAVSPYVAVVRRNKGVRSDHVPDQSRHMFTTTMDGTSRTSSFIPLLWTPLTPTF